MNQGSNGKKTQMKPLSITDNFCCVRVFFPFPNVCVRAYMCVRACVCVSVCVFEW